ncbi:hypothetical protein [Streptomyces sp. FIT100]|uniref:hypothetical protein n=1 Tax=Streptomyces sp. FIT100 TaxID=2837956 RepID=UPI0021C56F3B|nr:hypothetical protein [Streptomyces sp. FIT100]UUN26607.1 hypothetical protein KK483_09400 [Streptomyces sp. FIT100]
MKRLLRGVAYAVIPGEVALVVCLLAGVRPPAPVLAAAEVAMLVLLVAEAAVFVRLRRQGHSNRSAVRELVPEPVLRLTGHELRLMWSFVLWVARRRHGVGPDAQAFGHARDQAALMFGFGFVCVVETIGMSYLLSGWPVVHAIVLVLDVYSGIFFVFGLHAASVTRPHVLSPEALRVRKGAHVDVRIPLERIASASYELRFTHTRQDGVLDLAVGGQTSLTLELSEPVVSVGLLGKERRVRTVRIHADDARALLRALTQARSALSPPPGLPAERPAGRPG